MQTRKVEISLERSVTVGNVDRQFEKNKLFVALGAEPDPNEDRVAVAAALYADATRILDAQFEALTKSAGATAPAQKLAAATTATLEAASPMNAQPKPPVTTTIGVLYKCSECGSDVKDTPGNQRTLDYAKSKGYEPRCYSCNVTARAKYSRQ
jgi:DNA-directed RNA polymerase subunit RPC12/RpoP